MNDNVTDYGCITTTDTANTITGSWYEYTTPFYPAPTVNIPSVWYAPTPLYQNKKGDDNMRYLYEVILVNPKNDDFYVDRVVAKSETSALMEVYNDSPFNEMKDDIVKFDDLKTSCRVLMEWKKKDSLKKAIEIIKKAVE